MKTWYTDPEVDNTPIISSRVRLARNFDKFPFFAAISEEQSRKLVEETIGVLGQHFTSVNVSAISEHEKRRLVEKHIISPEFLKISKPKGLVLDADELVSVMVNEEDHVRIQTITPSDKIDNAWDIAGKVDDLLEERVQFAFDKDYGYLTSCPTNIGTGMRASFMAHLPMTERSGQLRNLLTAVSKFGMTMRGLYGEGSEPLGHIFQISNQLTLGKSEEEIIGSLKTITAQLIENENRLRDKAMSEHSLEMQDEFYRAIGILSYCRRISGKEAMELLSSARIGFITGAFNIPRPKQTIYEIMINIQPGALQAQAGRDLDENERDKIRAEYLRTIFSNV